MLHEFYSILVDEIQNTVSTIVLEQVHEFMRYVYIWLQKQLCFVKYFRHRKSLNSCIKGKIV